MILDVLWASVPFSCERGCFTAFLSLLLRLPLCQLHNAAFLFEKNSKVLVRPFGWSHCIDLCADAACGFWCRADGTMSASRSGFEQLFLCRSRLDLCIFLRDDAEAL